MMAAEPTTWPQHGDPFNLIERATIVGLNPGDVVVLHLPEDATQEQALAARHAWQATSQLPNPVMVMTGDCSIEIVRDLEAETRC